MKYKQALIPGVLIKRYKRFLADVRLNDGKIITVHTPNTGSMLGCAEPGLAVLLRDSCNPKRKYRFSWEMVRDKNDHWVGINTSLSNRLVKEAIEQGAIKELNHYQEIRQEVKVGQSRIDLLLQNHSKKPDCYVEVKNVTLVESETALFPDAVSERASKHLRELMTLVAKGYRGVIFFCIQRQDARRFMPAAHIDPQYANTLKQAMDSGVEAVAYAAAIKTHEIVLNRPIPVIPANLNPG